MEKANLTGGRGHCVSGCPLHARQTAQAGPLLVDSDETPRIRSKLMVGAGLLVPSIHALAPPHVHGVGGVVAHLTPSAVLVDEASMLDVHLAAALVNAVSLPNEAAESDTDDGDAGSSPSPHATRLVLVGDEDQLPSVGPGSVLADLMETGIVPRTHLTDVRPLWVQCFRCSPRLCSLFRFFCFPYLPCFHRASTSPTTWTIDNWRVACGRDIVWP